MSSNSSSSSSGIGVIGLLGVVFVTLKLIGVLHWSWWWVTLPFWGGIGLVVAILLGIGITVAISKLIAAIKGKRKPLSIRRVS